ncbi:MAG: response regulator [Chloroflexi bacterium]|nr:response regulator [Chloroflexota bacterium]
MTEHRSAVEPSSHRATGVRGPKLLVADRASELRTHIVDALSLGGLYDVAVVETGAEVLAQAAAQPFEAVVLAYDLPDMTGVDILRTWSAQGTPGHECPVVVLADEWAYPVALEATAGGAFDYVVKSPDMVSTLPLIVVRAIERQKLMETARDLELRLAQQARYDPLTHLCRPNHFQELYGRELDRLKRYGGFLALVLVDCSRTLRSLGDRAAKEQFLRMAGLRLAGQIRSADFAGIFGRAQLVVALPETTDTGASAVCRRLAALFTELCAEWAIGPAGQPEVCILRAGAYLDLADYALKLVPEPGPEVR